LQELYRWAVVRVKLDPVFAVSYFGGIGQVVKDVGSQLGVK